MLELVFHIVINRLMLDIFQSTWIIWYWLFMLPHIFLLVLSNSGLKKKFNKFVAYYRKLW